MRATDDSQLSHFADKPLPWHHAAWTPIVRSWQQGSLGHAFLFSGAAGIGKMAFAQALASRLLCLEPSGDFACGRCKSCELMKAGTHPDFLPLLPEAAGKPIKIDQIRQLNQWARKTAQQGGQRVVIINPAQAMNLNAANALLKSLEEPGSQTVFLLITDRLSVVLPTIRSRCQLVSLSTPDTVTAQQWLAPTVTDAEQQSLLLMLAGGAPLLAKQLHDHKTLDTRRKVIDGIGSMLKRETAIVELAKAWNTFDLPLLLGWFASWLDDAVRVSLTADKQRIRNHDVKKIVGYLGKKAAAATLMRVRDEITAAQQRLLDGANQNPQMVLEGVFCDLLTLMPNRR